MNKLLAIIVASTFVLSSASGFAVETAKQELTKEERIEMRARADKLTAKRAANPNATNAEHATKVKKHHVTKANKVSAHQAKKAHSKA